MNTNTAITPTRFITPVRTASLTVTSTPTHTAYRLDGPYSLAHTSAVPEEFGPTAGLMHALHRGLQSITTARLRAALKGLREQTEEQEPGCTAPERIDLLPIQVRSDASIGTAVLLMRSQPLPRDFDVKTNTNPVHGLQYQLRRFAIEWIPLPADSPELAELKAYAALSVASPGISDRNDECRRDYEAAFAARENPDAEPTCTGRTVNYGAYADQVSTHAPIFDPAPSSYAGYGCDQAG